MSHEIRTPISNIIDIAKILIRDHELDGRRRALTEDIYRSASALLDLVNDKLDMPRTLDIEAIPFSPLEVIQEVIMMFGYNALNKGLVFLSPLDPGMDSDFKVIGDPRCLRRVLANLVGNSIDSTNRGHVSFSATKERDTPEDMTIRFTIEDTGRVGNEVMNSIPKKSGRIGRGLSVSKSAVELMGGKITLDSSPSVGTTVTFSVTFKKPVFRQAMGSSSTSPATNTPPSESDRPCNKSVAVPEGGTSLWEASFSSKLLAQLDPDKELPVPDRARILVLVVEDNRISQQIALICIRKLGFSARAVWNGREALEYIAAAMAGMRFKPDIIVMDKTMPEMGGCRCTHILRRHRPYRNYVCDVPIVALTASSAERDKEECMAAGMNDYVTKPISGDTLKRVLIRWATPAPSGTTLYSGSRLELVGPGLDRFSDCNTPQADYDSWTLGSNGLVPELVEDEEGMSLSENTDPDTPVD